MCLTSVSAQGDPEEWPVDPLNGVCQTYPLPGYRAARSERRWLMPKLFAKTSRTIEFQVGRFRARQNVSAADVSRLYATRWSQRPKLAQGSLEPVTSLGAHTAYTFNRGEVFLGVSNPPFGSPFHPFPFTRLLFLFRFMSSFLRVLSSHLLSSFARTWPHTSFVRAQPTFNLGLRLPKFSSVVTVHLVPFGRNHTHTHLCPVLSSLHVFVCLSCCAHTYTFAWALEFVASRRGGVCVCVCVCVRV